jgi:hypothetical protein
LELEASQDLNSAILEILQQLASEETPLLLLETLTTGRVGLSLFFWERSVVGLPSAPPDLGPKTTSYLGE